MNQIDLVAYVGAAVLAAGLGVASYAATRQRGGVGRLWGRYTGGLNDSAQALTLDARGTDMALAQLAAIVGGAVLGYYVDLRLLVFIPLGIIGPRLWLAFQRKRRVKLIEEQLNSWLLMMANMLAVTGSLPEAFRYTADLTRGHLGRELDRLVKELRIGAPMEEALRAMGNRIGSNLFGSVVTIILIGRETGGELPSLLKKTAASLREILRLQAVLRKQTAMARMQLICLALGPPLLIYFLNKMDPTYFEPMLESGSVGYGLMALAGCAWVMSLIMARNILDVDF